MHTIIIPTYNENTAEIRLQTARRLRVQGVATIADGLKHTIEGPWPVNGAARGCGSPQPDW